jgi:hypothetical protein
MITFIATFRAIFQAESEGQAAMIADLVCENGARDLDEENDVLFTTQVTSNATDLSPEESVVTIRKARNALIKTRIKQCYEMAKELDKMAWILEHRADRDFSLAGYDYGDFFRTAEQIFLRNESPV